MRFINKLKHYFRDNQEENQEVPNNQSAIQKYFGAFGLIQNTTRLFYSPASQEYKHLELLNGIRVIATLWIILLHTYGNITIGPILNIKEFTHIVNLFTYSFNFVHYGQFAVDIFFWMTGFLASYLLMCSMNKKHGEMENPLKIYLHRIIRITPLYVMTLLFYWSLMASVGNGPIFYLYKKIHADYGDSTWWLNLTYSNTIPKLKDNQTRCMPWTWYISNDIQFYLLIPLVVYLLYHKRILGLLFIAFYQSMGFGLSLYFILKYDLTESYKKYNQDYASYIYYPSYSRAGPFTIGILVALLLYGFKHETEELSSIKKFMNKIDGSLVIRLIMYTLGVTIVLAHYNLYYFENVYPDSFSRTYNLMFLLLNGPVLVTGMSLILLPTFMGHNQITAWVLSQGVFAPLAKLTYGAYLVHYTFIIFNSYNTPGGEYATINSGIVNYLAWVVVSFTVSYLFSMLVEVPGINLESTFIFPRSNPNKDNNKGDEKALAKILRDPDVKERDATQSKHSIDDQEEAKSGRRYDVNKEVTARDALLK